MSSSISNIQALKEKVKKSFLARQYQSLNTEEIDRLHESILSAKPEKSDCNNSLKNQFNNPDFWTGLKEASGFSNEVEQLENQWNIIKRFADFNAQELMRLKRRVFDYADVAISRALEELESDLKRFELNGIWRPEWLLNLHKKQINMLRKKYQSYCGLENQLQNTLAIKATMHSTLGTQKHVDDIYIYFAKQINQLGVLKHPLLFPIEPSHCLDDDTRAAIHDYLENRKVLSEAELDSIIVPLNQLPYSVPVPPSQATKESKNIEGFADKIASQLQLTSVAKYKKEKEEQKITNTWLENKIIEPMKEYFFSMSLVEAVRDIWRYRWLLALISSVGLYTLFASAAIGIVTMTVGIWATGIATNILFYGLALLPAYIMGGKALNALGNIIYEKLSYWKSREIQQSLELLKLNQRFVSSQLSAGISDVALFDIAGLSAHSKSCIESIEKMVVALENVQGGVRFVYWGTLKASHLEVIDELKKQKQLIEDRLKTYSEHIGERLAGSLVNFRIDISDGKLKPAIPKGQIQSLHSFVKEHGTIESQSQFLKSTNLSNLFALALLNDKKFLQQTSSESYLNQPWGGYKSNIPSFRGWETLVKHYTVDEAQKDAALNIAGVLAGKRICTLANLGKWVSVIAPNNKQELMLNIQQHLFLSLDSQPASHARLLSTPQKELIKSWARANSRAIQDAQAFVRDLNSSSNHFSDQEESTLVKHFEALEGLDRLNVLQGQAGEANNIRIALENYNGKSTAAIYLLNFLPENIHSDFTVKVATQRLNRLISRAPKKGGTVFRRADKLLFIFLVQLPQIKDRFNLENQIRRHPKYNEPWTAEFSYFLNQCTECKLNDGSLEAEYELRNKRIKEFTQKLSDIFVPFCASEAEKNRATCKASINTMLGQAKEVRCA